MTSSTRLALPTAAIALAIALAAMLALAPAAGARGLFGTINQTPIGSEDIEPLRDANPASMRVLVLWNRVQEKEGRCAPGGSYNPGQGPGSNNCDWSSVDKLVGTSAKAGVRTLPFLLGTPEWLQSARKATEEQPWVPPIYSPSDRQAWAAFVRAAVKRYGPGGNYWREKDVRKRPVREWQVWNEPSSPTYMAPRPSVRRYVRLLKISSRVIRRTDRRAKVVLAGVFGSPRRRGGGIDMPKFFKRLYSIGGASRAFDIAAAHPYAQGTRGMRLQIQTVRRLMRQNGDGHKRLWVTEMGWSSEGPRGHTITSTRQGQARLMRKAFRLLRAKRRRWRLAGVNWFSWRDAPEDRSSCEACPWTGLLEQDGDRKPAFRMFMRFTRPGGGGREY